MNANKLPMCYAVMKIDEKLGNDLGDITIFVAAGCYIVRQTLEYLENGEFEISGDVVFMWNKTDDNNEPIFIQNKCINSVSVNKLFFSAEEAIMEAEEENKKYLVKKIMEISMDKIASIRVKAPELVKKYRTKSAEQLNKVQTIIDTNETNNIIKALKKA